MIRTAILLVAALVIALPSPRKLGVILNSVCRALFKCRWEDRLEHCVAAGLVARPVFLVR